MISFALYWVILGGSILPGRDKSSGALVIKWTCWDLNPGPLPCKGSDLPADLQAHMLIVGDISFVGTSAQQFLQLLLWYVRYDSLSISDRMVVTRFVRVLLRR